MTDTDAAWRAVVERVAPLVYAMTDGEEAFQDAFLRLYLRWSELDLDRDVDRPAAVTAGAVDPVGDAASRCRAST